MEGEPEIEKPPRKKHKKEEVLIKEEIDDA